MKTHYSKKGLSKIIALIALIFLGKSYSNGYEYMDYEKVSYKFESIYPDIETMNSIEKKLSTPPTNSES